MIRGHGGIYDHGQGGIYWLFELSWLQYHTCLGDSVHFLVPFFQYHIQMSAVFLPPASCPSRGEGPKTTHIKNLVESILDCEGVFTNRYGNVMHEDHLGFLTDEKSTDTKYVTLKLSILQLLLISVYFCNAHLYIYIFFYETCA